MKNANIEAVSASSDSGRIRSALFQLWGRPMDAQDLLICEVLGWADSNNPQSLVSRLASCDQAQDLSIYLNGQLRGYSVDAYVESLLGQWHLTCLDSFFAIDCSDEDFELRTLLTLMHYLETGEVGSIALCGELCFVDPVDAAALDDGAGIVANPTFDDSTWLK